MAKAAVALAGGAASSLDCKARLPQPTLPGAVQPTSEPGRQCDLPTSVLPPNAYVEQETRATGRSVSVCTLHGGGGGLDVITISDDPGLAETFTGPARTLRSGRLLTPQYDGYAGNQEAEVHLLCRRGCRPSPLPARRSPA